MKDKLYRYKDSSLIVKTKNIIENCCYNIYHDHCIECEVVQAGEDTQENKSYAIGDRYHTFCFILFGSPEFEKI